MFYRTKIQSVGNGFVTDVQGKKLFFVGDLPASVGDVVFTDGRYIFGNAPPKGNPAIFDEPSGIPVLGVRDDDELRGYFNSNGNFKTYNIKATDWLVNDKKTYKHDAGDGDIIDAEISEDRELYTVEKKISPKEPVEDDDVFHFYQQSEEQEETFALSYRDADYLMTDDETLKVCQIIISKDDTIIETRDFTDLFESVEFGTKNLVNFTIPDHDPENHIKSRATIKNFKVDRQGKWTALIQVEVFAERRFEAKRTELIYGMQIQQVSQTFVRAPNPDTFKDYGEWGSSGYTFLKGLAGVLPVTPLTMFAAAIRIDGAYSIIDPKPYVNTVSLGFSSVVAHVEKLFKISSDTEEPEIVFEKKKLYPLILSDFVQEAIMDNESKYIVKDNSELSLSKPQEEIPALRGFAADSVFPKILLNNYRIAYDGHFLIIRPVLFMAWAQPDDTRQIYFIPEWEFQYNSRDLYADDNLETIEAVENPETEKEIFSFPLQDDFYAQIKPHEQDDIDQWQLAEILDKDGKKVFDIPESDTDAHTWNMSLAQLKSGYLFGIHDGALYKIDKDNNVEQVGDRLKNFRLRELKKISKAKK